MTGTDVLPVGGAHTVVPRVNWGRWVVDCPACSSALLVDRDAHELGGWLYDVAGQRTRYGAGCWDCGARARLVWPGPAPFLDAVERILTLRPDEQTRNYSPGETLHDLIHENAVHGVFSEFLELAAAEPGTELLTVDDDRVVVDRLPAAGSIGRHRTRLQIGA